MERSSTMIGSVNARSRRLGTAKKALRRLPERSLGPEKLQGLTALPDTTLAAHST